MEHAMIISNNDEMMYKRNGAQKWCAHYFKIVCVCVCVNAAFWQLFHRDWSKPPPSI